MLAAMDRDFPPEVSWTHPLGGLFLWGTLPSYMDAKELLISCLDKKVAFVPGEPFHPTGGGVNTMRINFSNATHDEIQVGIRRLGTAIRKKLAREIA
jgi:DNA-binding transcriptional MocR family regulator